jgi:hypothetical protein
LIPKRRYCIIGSNGNGDEETTVEAYEGTCPSSEDSHYQNWAVKKYWDQFQPAPEFAFLFYRVKPSLVLHCENDPGLIEYAAGSEWLWLRQLR